MIPQLLNAMKKPKRTFTINAGENLFYGDVTNARKFGVKIISEKKRVQRDYEEGEEIEFEGKDLKALFSQCYKTDNGIKPEDICFTFESSKSVEELAKNFFPSYLESQYLFISEQKEAFFVSYHDVLGLAMGEEKHLTIHFKDYAEVYTNASNLDEITLKMIEIEERLQGSKPEELTEGDFDEDNTIEIPKK